MNTSSAPPIFIVSAGRSGSMMIADALARHPGLLALHEPLPHLSIEAYARWSRTHPRKRIVELVRTKRSAAIAQVAANGLIYVESSHFCAHLIGELNELYGARFVHLYRRGSDFVRSGLQRRTWYNESLRRKYQPARLVRDYFRRTHLIEVGRSFDEHRLKPPAELTTRFEKICWLWAEINRVILAAFEQLPPQGRMSLAVEDLDEGLLAGLCEFAGVATDQRIIADMMRFVRSRSNSTIERNVAPPEEWPACTMERFLQIAGDMMHRLGYTDAQGRVHPIRQR